jgi:hypothetical protein
MNEDRLPKRLLHWRPELVGGKRRRRRTRVRWLDVGEWDAATTGMTGIDRDLEEAAADRKGWRNIIELLMSE